MEKYRSAIIVFTFSLFLYLLNINGLSIYTFDEARNAGCAAEMLQTSEWIVPVFNDELRTLKPPLHYYFMIVAYKIGGINPFTARFFSGLFGALTILITFLFAQHYFGKKVAWWSALILWASLHFNIQVHMAVPDPYLIFFMTSMFWLFFHFLQTKKSLHIYGMYICMALCVLLKGPFAILLPGLIFLLFLIYSRQLNWETLRSFRMIKGLLLGLAIVLPWNIAVGLETNWEWNKAFYLTQNVGRYTSTMEGHGGNPLLTFAYVLMGMLPFSIFSFQAFVKTWKVPEKNSALKFSAILVLTFTLFFALSKTKLPNYTVPTYPFLAVLLAWNVHELLKKQSKFFIPLIIYSILAIAIPIAAYYGLAQESSVAHLKHLAFYFLLLPIGAILGIIFHAMGKNKQSLLAVGISGVLTSIAFFTVIFPPMDQNNPVIASRDILDPSKPILGYKLFNPAFIYELQHPIKSVEDGPTIHQFFDESPDGYLISRKKYLKDLEKIGEFEILFEQKDLFELSRTVLLRRKSVE